MEALKKSREFKAQEMPHLEAAWKPNTSKTSFIIGAKIKFERCSNEKKLFLQKSNHLSSQLINARNNGRKSTKKKL